MFESYYSTKMSGSARLLAARFEKMRSRSGRRYRLAAAAVTAVLTAMACMAAAAFAAIENKPVIQFKLYNGEKQVQLSHSPFIYNGEYFLPLRESLAGFGITDITYDNGEIHINFPEGDRDYVPDGFYLNSPGREREIRIRDYFEQDFGYVYMRAAPIIQDDVAYIPISFFEVLLYRSHSLEGFRLDVIRPTEPEYYYGRGEEVFIGTAEEQNEFTAFDEAGESKLVKRILTDNDGRVIAVIPIEQQKYENYKQDLWRLPSTSVFMGYPSLTRGSCGILDANYNIIPCCYPSVILRLCTAAVEEKEDFMAYLYPADFITCPYDLSPNERILVTNFYAN